MKQQLYLDVIVRGISRVAIEGLMCLIANGSGTTVDAIRSTVENVLNVNRFEETKACVKSYLPSWIVTIYLANRVYWI